MNPVYPWVSERANHRCEYCRPPELIFNFPFEVEHIIPLCQGGTDAEDNLALACRSCNLRKGIRTNGIDPHSGHEVCLFNPRQEHWHDHFEAIAENGALIGISPTGRATIAGLHINSQTQMTARRLWIQLGLFP
jgi:hypothetical protein